MTRRLVGGGCPFPPEIVDQSDPPRQKRRFPIYIRSKRVSRKRSERRSLSLRVSPLRAFHRTLPPRGPGAFRCISS